MKLNRSLTAFHQKADGLGLGTVETSAVFVAPILALVAYLSVTKRDTIERAAPA